MSIKTERQLNAEALHPYKHVDNQTNSQLQPISEPTPIPKIRRRCNIAVDQETFDELLKLQRPRETMGQLVNRLINDITKYLPADELPGKGK